MLHGSRMRFSVHVWSRRNLLFSRQSRSDFGQRDFCSPRNSTCVEPAAGAFRCIRQAFSATRHCPAQPDRQGDHEPAHQGQRSIFVQHCAGREKRCAGFQAGAGAHCCCARCGNPHFTQRRRWRTRRGRALRCLRPLQRQRLFSTGRGRGKLPGLPGIDKRVRPGSRQTFRRRVQTDCYMQAGAGTVSIDGLSGWRKVRRGRLWPD